MSELRFVALGMGRYVRADRVIAVVPIEGDLRGPGRRTHVWLEGVAEPLVASRGEGGIIADLAAGGVVPGAGADDDDVASPVVPDVEPPPSLF